MKLPALIFSLTLTAVLCGTAQASADRIVFGDAPSESSAHVHTAASVVETGLAGRPCRRIGPDGHLTFTLPCAPNQPNYLTLMLDGSETGRGQLYLYDGKSRIGGYQRDWPELDMLGGIPFFSGRFYYSTYLIPESMTAGKSQVTLTIGSTGQPTPYARDKKETPQKGLSRSMYAAVVHTDPFFQPAACDLIGAAPIPVPVPEYDAMSAVAHLHAQLEKVLEQVLSWQYYGPDWEALLAAGDAPPYMTGAINKGGHRDPTWSETQWKDTFVARSGVHVRSFMVPEIYARMYNASWSKYYQAPELLERVVLALDFYRRAQGSNGGFIEIEMNRPQTWIGGPDRKPGCGCLLGFGMMGPPAAFLELADVIEQQGLLAVMVDEDTNDEAPPVSRRAAYIAFFTGARDYLVSPGGRGHAPNQDMADILAAYLYDRCLQSLKADTVWTEKERQGYLDAACGFTEDIYGGYWISRAGLSMEPNGSSNGGFCGNYGEHIVDPLCWLARMTNDKHVRERAHQALDTLSLFRRPGLDAQGWPCVLLEGVVTWRNNHTPGRIAYGGQPYAAINGNKTALRALQLELELAHGRFHDVQLRKHGVHMLSQTVGLLRELTYLEEALSLPPTKARLPFEPGEPDFAWADPQAGNVVVKRGEERLVMALNWRHGYTNPKERSPENAKVNNLARIHHRTPAVARVANVRMESIGGYGGVYACQYGPYFVIMNAAAKSKTYVLPEAWTQPSRDLIKGKKVRRSRVQLKRYQTVVLVQE